MIACLTFLFFFSPVWYFCSSCWYLGHKKLFGWLKSSPWSQSSLAISPSFISLFMQYAHAPMSDDSAWNIFSYRSISSHSFLNFCARAYIICFLALLSVCGRVCSNSFNCFKATTMSSMSLCVAVFIVTFSSVATASAHRSK